MIGDSGSAATPVFLRGKKSIETADGFWEVCISIQFNLPAIHFHYTHYNHHKTYKLFILYTKK